MDDLISRLAVITLPIMPKEYREYQTFNLDDAYEQGWNDLQKCIELLPLAQPDQRCDDLISRQAAIDAVRKEYGGIKTLIWTGIFWQMRLSLFYLNCHPHSRNLGKAQINEYT